MWVKFQGSEVEDWNMETAALLASQTAQTVTYLIQRESPGAGWSYFQSETLPDIRPETVLVPGVDSETLPDEQPGTLPDVQE